MQASSNDIILFLITTTCIILLLSSLIITLLYFYKKRQTIHLEKISALKSDFEKTLIYTKMEIQEETFQHISKEIHDNISLSLTLAKLNLEAFAWKQNTDTKEHVKTSIEQIATAINDLGDLSKSMSADIVSSHGLLKAIEYELEDIRESSKLEIDLETNGNPVSMDIQRELILFRIIQESFKNILKHAKASRAVIKLSYSDHYLSIIIKDNGKGFDPQEIESQDDKIKSSGLKNIKHRSSILMGSSRIESQPGEGSSVFITIPLDQKNNSI